MSSAAADATAAAPPKSKKKLIIIVAAVLVLALGGGGGFMVYQQQQKAKAEAEADDHGDEAPAKKKAEKDHSKRDPKALPVYMPIEAFTVNLADRDGSRYAQITISLELDEAKTADTIKAYLPAIRNNVLLLLSQKTSAQLLDAQGKVKLAKEIQAEVLKPLGVEMEEDEPEVDKPGKKKRRRYEPEYPVRGVHFSSFIVQ